MASPSKAQPDEDHRLANGGRDFSSQDAVASSDPATMLHADSKTPDPQPDQQDRHTNSNTPDTPGLLSPFDWEDFEARYERALRDAEEDEREILKEAAALSKYFQVWASAASSHDNERAAKRLQTRQRFVNLSEEKLAQRQKHYEEVVRAFENALALLQST